MTDITSASNAKCRYVKALSRRKAREENGEYTVEGIKSVKEAIESEACVSSLFISCSLYEKKSLELPRDVPLYRVRDDIFEKMCDTKAPQGILAVIKMQKISLSADIGKAYVYCDRISDPGNLGTIIRTADAAGLGGVLLSPGCADLYNPKTIRASMGSFFYIPVIDNAGYEWLLRFKEMGFRLLGGTLSETSVDYKRAEIKKPAVIIVGNEANGISDKVLGICEHIKIPILGNAESLNAAVAAAILMYETVS